MARPRKKRVQPGPEEVVCPICGRAEEVKLAGTLPRMWFAVYLGPGNYPRLCSSECMDTAKRELRNSK